MSNLPSPFNSPRGSPTPSAHPSASGGGAKPSPSQGSQSKPAPTATSAPPPQPPPPQPQQPPQWPIPLLAPLRLHSRIAAPHALAFSADAELAVAAHDSVHVLLPVFPTLAAGGSESSAAAGWKEADEDGNPMPPSTSNNPTALPPTQYALHPLQISFSSSPPDPLVNAGLFAAASGGAGVPFPVLAPVKIYDGAPSPDDERHLPPPLRVRVPLGAVAGPSYRPHPGPGRPRKDLAVELDGSHSGGGNDGRGGGGDGGGATSATTTTTVLVQGRVGAGVVSGPGASPNQVVAGGVRWSPPGVGRSGRAVLAVLGAGGWVVVYGEGGGKGRSKSARDLEGWRILFGFGNHLPLPAQARKWAAGKREHVTAFAWARGMDVSEGGTADGSRGRALVAYATDEHDVVIVAVQSRFDPADHGPEWSVDEVARFKSLGPHPLLEPSDPEYTPHGSALSLAFGPWEMKADASRTCLISYVAKNYVGFRRITIKNRWDFGITPEICMDEGDYDGICVFLSTDAFVSWEDSIITNNGKKACRGIIATPMEVAPFEVSLVNGEPKPEWDHPTSECGTTYQSDASALQFNPITGLILDPIDPSNPPPEPLYTLVRLSATASTSGWYETNVVADGQLPKWATTVRNKVDISIPADFHDPRGLLDDDDMGVGEKRRKTGNDKGEADDDDGLDDDDEEDEDSGEEDDEEDEDEDEDVNASKAAADDAAVLGLGLRPVEAGSSEFSEEVHPYRVSIWDLATVPGGATSFSAVLITYHLAAWPDKESRRSGCTVLFSSVGGNHAANFGGLDGADEAQGDDDCNGVSTRRSTEARVWDFMYAGGPPVPGIAGGVRDTSLRTKALRTALAPVASSPRQRNCPFCGAKLEPLGGGSEDAASLQRKRKVRCTGVDRQQRPADSGSGGTARHVLDVCAATGLPITAPGVSRACAVCGARTLVARELLRLVRAEMAGGENGEGKDVEARGELLETAVKEELREGRCGGCGGKFVD